MRRDTTAPRLVRALRGALGVVAVLAALSLFWLAAYYGVPWLATRLDLRVAGATLQVVASIVGLLLFGALAGTLGSRYRGREVDAWRQLVDALRRIAEGDFSVRIEPFDQRGQHPFDQLATGVNDMAEELDRLERMRQDFIANVSHEIQSPLASIDGFARTLQENETEPEERRRYLRIIQTEVSRLSRLSDHLLRLTVLDSEGHQLDLRPYRLDAQLRRAVLAAEPQWTSKTLDLDIALEPLTVTADEALLDQVWTNLLHNAIKFTPAGGSIAVRARPDDDRLTVTIEDNGIGIAPRDLDHVFERFYKGDLSRNREEGGSGLGLALARKIVQVHGGDISLESTLSQGTRVVVSFPSKQAATAAGDRTSEGRAYLGT